jgi:hypothetical protein
MHYLQIEDEFTRFGFPQKGKAMKSFSPRRVRGENTPTSAAWGGVHQ